MVGAKRIQLTCTFLQLSSFTVYKTCHQKYQGKDNWGQFLYFGHINEVGPLTCKSVIYIKLK